MYNFGAGTLIGVPLTDTLGNAITNPSPVQFGTLQNINITETWESKELYGAKQFPVAVGRGKGKVMLKAKAATINAELWNTFVYGLTLGTTYQNVYNDSVGTAVPTTPYSVTPTSATFVEDLGVQDGNGVPYTRVAAGPTGYQYTFTLNTGVGKYTFSSVSFAATVFISYAYSATVATAKSIAVINEPMGYQPSFECHFATSYLGKTAYIKYPNCVANSLSRDLKNDDWTIPDFEIHCFADASNNISYLYMYE